MSGVAFALDCVREPRRLVAELLLVEIADDRDPGGKRFPVLFRRGLELALFLGHSPRSSNDGSSGTKRAWRFVCYVSTSGSAQPGTAAADKVLMQTRHFETEMWLLALAQTSSARSHVQTNREGLARPRAVLLLSATSKGDRSRTAHRSTRVA